MSQLIKQMASKALQTRTTGYNMSSRQFHRFRIRPILGRKTDVAPNDPSLFRYIGDSEALTHDTGGQNVDYQRRDNVCTKSEGFAAWSNSAAGTPTYCSGLYELISTTGTIDNLMWDSGNFYYFDGSNDPVEVKGYLLYYDNLAGGTISYGDTIVGATGGTSADVVYSSDDIGGGNYLLYLENITGGDGSFDNNEQIAVGGVTADCVGNLTELTPCSGAGSYPNAIRYGNYVLFANDYVGYPIMKWSNGDGNITPLISKDEASYYTFKFIAEFHNRIIGASSGETNGPLEIRWTDALPTFMDLEFPSANQLYKPGTDPIRGISKMGSNSLYLYSRDSIDRIIYNANIDTVFSIETKINGTGCASHNSIINLHGYNYFYNNDLGFVRYDGGTRITPSDIISRDIKTDLKSISTSYSRYIQGKFIPYTNEIVWTVPISGTTNNYLYYYNIESGQWRIEDKVAYYIDMWTRATGEYQKPVFANTDGYVYKIAGELYAGASEIEAYRYEPIMDFGTMRKKRLQEIWFGVTDGGAYSIDNAIRVGDTVKEVLGKSWTALSSLSLNNPPEPCIRLDQSARFIQFKWGTDSDSEKYGVNTIDFAYHIEAD